MRTIYIYILIIPILFSRCGLDQTRKEEILPVIVTKPILGDTDDPAIWVHPTKKSESIIIGTDKGGDHSSGALYVYRLDGTIDSTRCVFGLQRPNNVDVEYGLSNGLGQTDIVVFTERERNMIRVFSLPDMKAMDGGGIPVFEGETEKAPMGIALYKDGLSGKIYAVVGRKNGPKEGYLFQYELSLDMEGNVGAKKVRSFGKYSGKKEIESVVVDDELGYVYYSDEGVGVRKYYAHPDSSTLELALFGVEGIKEDHEGLSIYKTDKTSGYILLSDQQANTFHVFPREGEKSNSHQHRCLAVIPTHTRESDGSDIVSDSLNTVFSKGMFVAMSTDGTFQFYRWQDIQTRITN